MKHFLDQSAPVRPGFIRVPRFMDVAVYDDAAFIDYTKDDPFWQTMLGGKRAQGDTPTARLYREGCFNTEHFENSVMAHAWNEFVAKRKLLLALKDARYALDPTAALLERGHAGNKDGENALKAAVEAISYAEA